MVVRFVWIVSSVFRFCRAVIYRSVCLVRDEVQRAEAVWVDQNIYVATRIDESIKNGTVDRVYAFINTHTHTHTPNTLHETPHPVNHTYIHTHYILSPPLTYTPRLLTKRNLPYTQAHMHRTTCPYLRVVVCRLKARISERASIARQRSVKDHCWATLGKHCLKVGILKSESDRDFHCRATAQ
jgi:hypothetical protein